MFVVDRREHDRRSEGEHRSREAEVFWPQSSRVEAGAARKGSQGWGHAQGPWPPERSNALLQGNVFQERNTNKVSV